MAQPSETITRTFFVEDASGVAITGLVTADFAGPGYRNGAVSAISFTVAEIGAGVYSVAYTLPASAGLVDFYFAPVLATRFIRWPDLSEEVEQHDLTSLYGAVAKPTIVLNATGAPSNEIELKFITGDQHEATFTVKNSDGTVVDLVAAGYSNWKFGVKNALQTAVPGVVPYLLNANISGDANGVITMVIPEGASFYGLLATGESATTGARWSLEADYAGDATKTRTLGRGACTVLRKETL